MSRLIDADELIEEIKSHRMVITGMRYGKSALNEYVKCFVESILKIIDEQPTVNGWIPCSKRLPEERESIFAKFKGTDKWRSAMFEKMSDNVNVTVEFEDGTRKSMKGYTVDGKWKPDTAVKCKVIAWQPLPESYNPERSNT